MRRIFSDRELEYIKENYLDKTYQEIADDINQFNDIKKSNKQVRTKASVMGLSKKKYNFDKDFFKEIDDEYKAYWLGFIFADGYVVERKDSRNYELGIELSIVDKSHLEKFNQSIRGNFKISTRMSSESVIDDRIIYSTETSLIRVYSVDMVRNLKKLGVVQNKTYKKDFPTVSDELFIPFVRGFMDGDGSIASDGKSVYFTNPNKEFLIYLKNSLGRLLNVKTGSLYQETEWKSRFGIYSQKDVSLYLNAIYEKSNVHLDRKYEIYKHHKSELVA